MPQKRLTVAMVERIAAPAKGQVEYWDKNMPGFGLRVSYRGTKALKQADDEGAAWHLLMRGAPLARWQGSGRRSS